VKNVIWEFYKSEKHHGKKATAYDVQLNGFSRALVFYNDPEHQRMCHCQMCKTKIPREVPRIKFLASFYYRAGYYCLTCGLKKLREKENELSTAKDTLDGQIKKLREVQKIAEEVINDPDEFYKKRMALGKMFQVMSENTRKKDY